MKIVDARTGRGKTTWAINYMKSNPDKKFVYITPFLTEVERIESECDNFRQPQSVGKGKLNSLHSLLSRGYNISSTHALFKTSNQHTNELFESGRYTLILDEVMDVVETIPVKSSDIKLMSDGGLIKLEPDCKVVWIDSKYDGTAFNELKQVIQTDRVYCYNNTMFMWVFPIDMFCSFDEVYVLTYMFDCQIQKYYYDLYGVEYSYYTIPQLGDDIVKTTQSEIIKYDRRSDIKKLINIINNTKMHTIGDKRTALSKSWFERTVNRDNIKVLANHLYNCYRNIFASNSELFLWTTFKDFQQTLGKKRLESTFLSCRARATNDYRGRKHLAYCVNLFINPSIKAFFNDNGVEVDEEKYALSEMIQWIFRSAIREGKHIQIYLPSARMRGLLINYLNERI